MNRPFPFGKSSLVGDTLGIRGFRSGKSANFVPVKHN